jgi:hypothetical protein
MGPSTITARRMADHLLGQSRLRHDATFVGRKAKGVDLQALGRAEAAAAAGANRDDIWRDTGWFRGPDGQWMTEIDDSGAKLLRGAPATGRTTQLKTVLDHPKLYDAVPEAANIKTLIENTDDDNAENAAAFYHPTKRTIQVFGRGMGAERKRQILLHEAQHGVDHIVTGIKNQNAPQRPVVNRDSYDRYLAITRRARNLIDEGRPDAGRRLFEEAKQAEDFGAYQSSPTELLAFTTERRGKMSAAQRRAVPPWQSAPIDWDQAYDGTTDHYGTYTHPKPKMDLAPGYRDFLSDLNDHLRGKGVNRPGDFTPEDDYEVLYENSKTLPDDLYNRGSEVFRDVFDLNRRRK